MKKTVDATRAICTFLFGLFLITLPATTRAGEAENLAQYRDQKVTSGAKTLPVLARIASSEAATLILDRDFEGAQRQLEQSLAYDPQHVKAHLLLALVKLCQLDIEAPVHLLAAFTAIGKNFRAQTFLVLNTVLAIPYVLVLASLIVCIAFAIKYLPFAAHRIREFLQMRLRAAIPGPAAYLILLLPVVLFPGAITILAYSMIVCWLFMYRTERFLLMTLLVPFVLLGFLGSYLRPLTPLENTKSLTSLIALANDAPGDSRLITTIEATPAEGLEAEKNIALGLLHQRSGEFTSAADHYYKAIAFAPEDSKGYINLGNMYYLQGIYDKALEGYRKAESIDAKDPVSQHALAQASIKTLLMKEASKSLQASVELGLDDVKRSYATAALDHIAVFPKTFSSPELWRMALVESKSVTRDALSERLFSLTGVSPKVGAWIILGAFLIALVLAKTIDPARLTFQCSNCGKLTCLKCCDTDREIALCQDCAATVAGVTSEKVTEALLRQKRQSVVVSRRKSSRFLTVLLPGMRDISFGRISRGFRLACMFSIGVVYLAARGILLRDDMTPPTGSSIFHVIVPTALILLAYAQSMFSKANYNFKAYKQPRSRSTVKRMDLGGGERAA